MTTTDERCICVPGDGCAENYESGDPRLCLYCLNLDSEWPCPADEDTGRVIDASGLLAHIERLEAVVEAAREITGVATQWSLRGVALDRLHDLGEPFVIELIVLEGLEDPAPERQWCPHCGSVPHHWQCRRGIFDEKVVGP